MGDSTLQTVTAPSGIEITLRTDVVARCPVDSGTDLYDVEVRIIPDGKSIECESFQQYLDEYAEVELSQESLAKEIGKTIDAALSEATFHVELSGKHSGVSCDVRYR